MFTPNPIQKNRKSWDRSAAKVVGLVAPQGETQGFRSIHRFGVNAALELELRAIFRSL